MNKNYFLIFLFVLFTFNEIIAEPCPQGAASLNGGTKIVFSYASGTSLCGNRPTTITVDGTTTFDLDPFSCSDTVSEYNLTGGPAVGTDFTVTSGFDSACNYASGTLPVDDKTLLSTNLKIFPNPLKSGNSIQLVFGLPVNAKYNVYDITGKMILSDVINNETRTEIDSRSLLNGIYMLKISTDKASTTRKIVIMK